MFFCSYFHYFWWFLANSASFGVTFGTLLGCFFEAFLISHFGIAFTSFFWKKCNLAHARINNNVHARISIEKRWCWKAYRARKACTKQAATTHTNAELSVADGGLRRSTTWCNTWSASTQRNAPQRSCDNTETGAQRGRPAPGAATSWASGTWPSTRRPPNVEAVAVVGNSTIGNHREHETYEHRPVIRLHDFVFAKQLRSSCWRFW